MRQAKYVVLATLDGTVPFVSLASLTAATAAVAVDVLAIKEWNTQDLRLLKRRECFTSIYILFITEKFLAAIPHSYG